MPDTALQAFDFVNIMVYSTLSDAMSQVAYYVQQKKVPPSQAVLGVGFFGNNDSISYKAILAANPNAWMSDSSNGVMYTGPATMAQETQLGAKNGGIMIWTLEEDLPAVCTTGKCVAAPHSLLKAVQDNL